MYPIWKPGRHCNGGAKNKANCVIVAGLPYLFTDIYFREHVEGDVDFMSVESEIQK